MEINDLLFKELLKRGYKLEGTKRVWDLADSKLWYLTPKQAQGFLDLEKTENYRKSIIQREISIRCRIFICISYSKKYIRQRFHKRYKR